MRDVRTSATASITAPELSFASAANGKGMSGCAVVENDRETGPRLKFYSQRADVTYWTRLWNAQRDLPYDRERRGHLPHQLRDTFTRWVKPGAKVLEAGCGTGRFTVAIDALGYRAEGLDWSSDTIAQMRRRFPAIAWHVGDVRELHFETGSLDAIYSPGVCEHFEEGPAEVLLETHRVLRPGGIAVVSTPCFNDWLRRHAPATAGKHVPDGLEFYQYAFTPDGMARLLTRLGFDVLQIRPYASLATFTRHLGVELPPRLTRPLALALDYLPAIRQWGSTCIWVARKC